MVAHTNIKDHHHDYDRRYIFEAKLDMSRYNLSWLVDIYVTECQPKSLQ